MSRDDESVTSSLRHRDVELIERLSDVIDTRNSSSSSNQRINLNELINFTDYSGFRPAQLRSRTEMALLCVAYLVIFCVSLFANTLVCHVIRRHRRLHSVTNVFIANLAVSDIFITLVNIPFNVVRHVTAGWALGQTTCALANLALTAFVYVSTLTMTAIAVDRYVVILHPLQPRMSVTVGLAVVAVTWIVAVLLSLPFAVFAQVRQVELLLYSAARCSVVYPSPSDVIERHVTMATFVCQYVLPMLVTSLAYGRIACRLWWRGRDLAGLAGSGGGLLPTERQRVCHERARRRSVALLASVVLVFGVSWLPLNLYHVLTDFHPDTATFYYNSKAYVAVHWLAVSSVCFNPFAYCWLNASFRDTLRVTCRHCCTLRRPRLRQRHHSLVSADDHVICLAPAAAAVRSDRPGRHDCCQSPVHQQRRQHELQQSQHQRKSPTYYYCVWRASSPIPVVCEQEPSSAVAALAADSPASSSSSADRPQLPLDVGVSSHHDSYNDVIASTDVTAPEQLRHRCSWPEDALAEHLMDMRSC